MAIKLLFAFLLFSSISFGHLHIDGIYKGENLYVQNPISEKGNTFCTDSVYVNGAKLEISIQLSVIEIPLDRLGLEKNDSLNIVIYHKKDCNPILLHVFKSITIPIKVRSLEVNSTGLMTWETMIEAPCYLIVQQYKWNRWINLDTIQTDKEAVFEAYSYQVELHSRSNKFRIQGLGYGSFKHTTHSIETKSLESKVSFIIDKSNHVLNFDAITCYELYDMTGELVTIGKDKSVSLSKFKDRKYVLCYDNSTTIIKLKWNKKN
ncbi:MAG: hypothetical protein GQ574_14275 [Crocinitomix sp.]|nr:hypothetical protein [Crocinitomix sp.]